MRVAERFRLLADDRGHALRQSKPLPWLTSRGHAAVEGRIPDEVHASLGSIFAVLDGDEDALAAKPARSVAPDFLLGDTQVEFDEDQHFTIYRLATFALYPRGTTLAFDVGEYAKTCLRYSKQAERAFAHKMAAEFPGPASRARQRAYFDAYRDLVGLYFGNGPVIRIPAPERDAEMALTRFEQMLSRGRFATS